MSNIFKCLPFLGAFLLPFSTIAIAQQNAIPAAPHILVYGAAQAQAIPDRFRLNIKVEVLDIDANKAREFAAKIFDSTIKKLKMLGVEDNNITASSLSIKPSRTYDEELADYVFEGTEVVRDIKVVFEQTGTMEKFLAETEVNENLQVSGVSTFLSSKGQLELALRAKSIESSKSKADAIAKEYGLRIKGVYSVSDVAPQYQYGIAEGDWPIIWFWDASGDYAELDYASVVKNKSSEHFSTGLVTFEDKIYVVFLVENEASD